VNAPWFAFQAVVADSADGDQDAFRGALAEAGLPFVMVLKPRRGTLACGPDAHTPVDAARRAGLGRAGRSRGLAPGDADLP
jgi:DDE superfamily endonuclease